MNGTGNRAGDDDFFGHEHLPAARWEFQFVDHRIEAFSEETQDFRNLALIDD
jgi:hypothetical protein